MMFGERKLEKEREREVGGNVRYEIKRPEQERFLVVEKQLDYVSFRSEVGKRWWWLLMTGLSGPSKWKLLINFTRDGNTSAIFW